MEETEVINAKVDKINPEEQFDTMIGLIKENYLSKEELKKLILKLLEIDKEYFSTTDKILNP